MYNLIEVEQCTHTPVFFFFYPAVKHFCNSCLIPPSPPPHAETHYRNTISNAFTQARDRLQTNLYSARKQRAAEIYLLSGEERNKLAREPWVTPQLTWRWISVPCKCTEGKDILHSVIQCIAARRIPFILPAGTRSLGLWVHRYTLLIIWDVFLITAEP